MSSSSPIPRLTLLERMLEFLRDLSTPDGRRRMRTRVRRVMRPRLRLASARPMLETWRPHDIAERLARRARRADSSGEHRQGSPSGGLAVRERYGSDFYSAIGARGGGTVLEERGVEYLQDIGSRGGAATRAKYGPEHYAEIGRKGGLAGRGRPRPRKRPGQLELDL